MIKSGIITPTKTIELENKKIIPLLTDMLKLFSSTEMETYKKYEDSNIIKDDEIMIKYFVGFLGYTIVHDQNVYYREESNIDRLEYVRNNYRLNKISKLMISNNRIRKYRSDAEMKFERDGFEHSMSPENCLSFWYPKTKNIGFRTPKTMITPLYIEEVNLIKATQWKKINGQALLSRILDDSFDSDIDLSKEMFLRLGETSNKFNFSTCRIKSIEEIIPKLMKVFEEVYFKIEWVEKLNVVLREFIKPNYSRKTIYNGMPLNTEFRVFYDFDKNRIIETFNYWDTNTMLENLHNNEELLTYASEAETISSEYAKLKPILEHEVKEKMHAANLTGKWSVDFLYDGKNFVLIDMAHAECSYYYDKVLKKELK